MSIMNFIPTIWSENLYSELNKKYIAVKNCNRQYEGDIKGCGSVVKICGVGNIEIYDYEKHRDLFMPQELEETTKTLPITEAKCFNFEIDDIDRAQSIPGIMNEAMRNAANALANEADTFIYRLTPQASKTITNSDPTVDNILDTFLAARKELYKNNVTDSSDVFFEVSPDVAELIIRAKIAVSTDNSDALENGCIGRIAGCKVYVSNNIQQEEVGGVYHDLCLARTKRAIAFAEQISEIEAYRPEMRFADAVKGLHLYGANVIYPKELISIKIKNSEG